MKTITKFIYPAFATVAFACFALVPTTRAVSPAPDGCYPNLTTAEGCDALKSLTTGAGNTGVGWRSLFVNTTGNFNTGVGAGALLLNNGDSNTAVGAVALLLNTTGSNNTAVGTTALLNNTEGNDNTAIGQNALQTNTTGYWNTATGALALAANTIGFSNTAFGRAALFTNTEGIENTALGIYCLEFNTTGNDNVAIGNSALQANTTGSGNVATGQGALLNSTTADDNTAHGTFALGSNTTGIRNTAMGRDALVSNTGGSENTGIGYGALSNSTGSDNVALGIFAGAALDTGNSNIDIYDVGVAGESNTIRIGTTGTHMATYIAGISSTAVVGDMVVVDANGKLGTMMSSRRFKKEIKPMDKTSEAILELKPVSFRYKSDSKSTPRFGLIAEEVAEVNPDLVVRDRKGEIYSVRYEAVNAMLLNEFLKEHRTVQELKSVVAKQEAAAALQQKQIEALTTGLQKVSAQLEASKPAPQVVNNP